jgi:excinuclease ABC subunit C
MKESFVCRLSLNKMKLLDYAKNMPLCPGVYVWLDNKNKPLYIGRATSLRRRVLQYFRPNIDARIGEMVNLANKIKYYETASVLEAIILEANLIKKYWPKYNVVDKDDRSFLYIVIAKTDFPKPIIVRGRELKNFPTGTARVFGPYQSYAIIARALKLLRSLFPYSVCKPTGKPCFQHQIGLCPGVCIGAISEKDYQKNIDDLVLFLRGDKKKLLKKLAKENPDAAKGLRNIHDATLITREDLDANPGQFSRVEGYDISHFASHEVYGSMVVFTNDLPDKSQYRLFKIKTVGNNDLVALKEMIARRLKHAEWPKPDLILLDGGRPQVDYIYHFFQASRVNIPLLGLSKLNGDHLVFPIGTKATFKDLAEATRRIFTQVRDEAHRFANRGRSRRYSSDNFKA